MTHRKFLLEGEGTLCFKKLAQAIPQHCSQNLACDINTKSGCVDFRKRQVWANPDYSNLPLIKKWWGRHLHFSITSLARNDSGLAQFLNKENKLLLPLKLWETIRNYHIKGSKNIVVSFQIQHLCWQNQANKCKQNKSAERSMKTQYKRD